MTTTALLQHWEGVVTELIDAKTFGAILYDLTNPANPEEYATLYTQDIPEEDRKHIALGIPFDWRIFDATEEVKLASPHCYMGKQEIKLRLSFWTQEELDAAKRKAKEYADFFG